MEEVTKQCSISQFRLVQYITVEYSAVEYAWLHPVIGCVALTTDKSTVGTGGRGDTLSLTKKKQYGSGLRGRLEIPY